MSDADNTPEMTPEEQEKLGALVVFGVVDHEGKPSGFNLEKALGLGFHATVSGASTATTLTHSKTLAHLGAHWTARATRLTKLGLFTTKPPIPGALTPGAIAANPGLLGKFGKVARVGARFPVIGLATEGLSDTQSTWDRTKKVFNGIGTGFEKTWDGAKKAVKGDGLGATIDLCDAFTGTFKPIGEAGASVAGAGLLGSAEAGRGVFHMTNWDDPNERERGARMFLNNNVVTDVANLAHSAGIVDNPTTFMAQGLDGNKLREETFRELGVTNMMELNDFREFKAKMLAKLKVYKTPEREGEITHVNSADGSLLSLDDSIALIEKLPDELPKPILAHKQEIEELKKKVADGSIFNNVSAPGGAGGTTSSGSGGFTPSGKPEEGPESGNMITRLIKQVIAWVSRQWDNVTSYFKSDSTPKPETVTPPKPEAKADTPQLASRLQPAVQTNDFSALGNISPMPATVSTNAASAEGRGAASEGAR